MRYIRTKDGRIIDKERVIKGLELVHLEDAPTDYCPCNGWYWKDQDGDYELEVGDDEIEREADTIEELCDSRYWTVYWKNGHIEFMAERNAKWHWENNRSLINKVCASTFAPRGFEIRAKLNSKGELEPL
jgi:hypothetical protein